MARNRMFLIFRLIISAMNVAESKSQYETILEYIKEITATNHQRSLVLVYNNQSVFEELSASFYSLDLPLYNIYLSEVKKFNGKYHDQYDIKVTFEESKLYFMVINNLHDFYFELLLMRKIYFWRDRDRVVVFVNEIYGDRLLLRRIFDFCFKHYIINVVFAFIQGGIASYTYNPFSGDYSLPLSNPGDLFPDKFQDLYGYQLKISMFPSVVEVFEDGTYQGRDGFVSRTIAQHINATYVYMLPRKTDLAPILNQYDDVAERVVDVGFNTRYVKFNFKNLIEKTYPHDRDDLACLIPKIGRKKTIGFMSLLPEIVWLLSLATSLLFFFYVLACMLMEGHRPDLVGLSMMILLLLINKPIKELRVFNFRSVLILYLLFCFFLNTLFTCKLTSVFTAPENYHDIDTVKDLAETNYEILTIDRFQELLNASLIQPMKKKIFNRMTIIKEEHYLDEMRKCRNVVFICKDHLANYAQIQKENYPNGLQFYRIMKEKILPTLSCYIVGYGSPFLMRFDVLVRRIVESGLNDYWKTTTWRKLGIDVHFRFDKNNYSSDASVSIEEFWITIQVLLAGLGISFLVFLLELVTGKCNGKTKVVYNICNQPYKQ
ncbi:hypothetical protein BDFB_005087 [Asbolus verrucosus]|uniref:Lig chan domain containing protein n=1 Tax=Asbolus verrucosus TaxID=1661398 RepID=A0A482W587_ASBVE|nr:hypothetical protein BDFB_005087 [Asbolus verrucosus]